MAILFCLRVLPFLNVSKLLTLSCQKKITLTFSTSSNQLRKSWFILQQYISTPNAIKKDKQAETSLDAAAQKRENNLNTQRNLSPILSTSSENE